MNSEIMALIVPLLIYIVVWFIVDIIFGAVTAAIGSSFWWGFWLGPIGILIAAVRVNGKRSQIVVVNASPLQSIRTPSGQIAIRRGSGRAALQTPKPPETEMEVFERRFKAGQAARRSR